MTDPAKDRAERQAWADQVYALSVLKQDKVGAIAALLPPLAGKTCLDLGGDNGVVSLKLRQMGGTWSSADLSAKAVEATKALVGGEVRTFDGRRLPFDDSAFDLVVVVDMLEHVADDRGLMAEVRRVLRPGGEVIVNVPHLKPASLINRVRHAIGLTDERHGHLRPGYDLAGLTRVLAPDFGITSSRTYSKSFSEAIDTALNGMYSLRQRGQQEDLHTSKGIVVTQEELGGGQGGGGMGALKLAYPVIKAVSRLDGLLFAAQGYKLIVKARLNSSSEDGRIQ